MPADTPEKVVEELMGAWLKSPLHGCHFARMAIVRKREQLGVYFDSSASLPPQIDALVRVAQEKNQLALAVLPNLTLAEHVAQFVHAMERRPTWTVSLRPNDDKAYVLVDLRRDMGDDIHASAIGFAPLGSMPITRRAPFTALALWPGGFKNPFRRHPDEFVGMGDMDPFDLEEAEYRELVKRTRANVRRYRETLRDPSIQTGVTFRLPKTAWTRRNRR